MHADTRMPTNAALPNDSTHPPLTLLSMGFERGLNHNHPHVLCCTMTVETLNGPKLLGICRPIGICFAPQGFCALFMRKRGAFLAGPDRTLLAGEAEWLAGSCRGFSFGPLMSNGRRSGFGGGGVVGAVYGGEGEEGRSEVSHSTHHAHSIPFFSILPTALL